MKPNFDVAFLPEAITFLENLDEKAREKIYYNIKKAQFIADSELFKKLNDFIWEFRTLYNSKAYRLFAFWDKVEGKEIGVTQRPPCDSSVEKRMVKRILYHEGTKTQSMKQLFFPLCLRAFVVNSFNCTSLF